MEINLGKVGAPRQKKTGDALDKERKYTRNIMKFAALVFWVDFALIGWFHGWLLATSILNMIFMVIIIMRQKFIFIERCPKEDR